MISSILKKISLDQSHNYFLVSVIFYLALFLSNSNKITFLISIFYLGSLYLINKNLIFSTFLVFISLLPFAKGKALQIPLITREAIRRYALFDLNFYFMVYISDFFLSILVYLYLRKKIKQELIITRITSKNVLWAVLSFISLAGVALLRLISTQFFDVIFLSTLQLLKLLVIFLLSLKLFSLKHREETAVVDIISSAVLFQSTWVILQRINNGYLGKDLEVVLPNIGNALVSAENPNLLRATGTFFEPSILGTFLLMNLGIIAYILLHRKKIDSLRKNYYLTTLFLGLIAIIFTGSRALYGLTLVATLILLREYNFKLAKINPFLKSSSKFIKKHFLLFTTTVLAVISVASYLIKRLESIPTLFAADGSAMYRIQLNLYAVRLSLRNFLGTGLNLSPYELATSFPNETYIFDPAHPHNIFFQILAETGILGLVSFLLFLYFLFRPFVLKSKALNAFSIGAILFLVCAQIYPIFLNHPEILSFFFAYLGLQQNRALHHD